MIKRMLITLATVSFFLPTICMEKKEKLDRILSHTIIDSELQPTSRLLDLLGKLNVKHNGSLESIKNETQKQWLRPANLEREESPEIYAEKTAELLPCFKNLGLIDTIEPLQQSYDQVIVLSNMVQPFRQRMAFTYELWKRGITFEKIYLIGSERKLHPKFESTQILFDAKNPDLPFEENWKLAKHAPTFDTEMLEMVYDQAPYAAHFKTIPLTVLNVLNQKKADGTEVRANTGAQVLEWVKLNSTNSSLWISNNPYIAYQDSVIRAYIPQSFQVETVGPKADETKSNINQDCLDTIARIIYQESLRKHK